MENLPFSRTVTLIPGDGVPSNLLNEIQDNLVALNGALSGGLQTKWPSDPSLAGNLTVGGQLLPFADFTFTATGSSAVLTATAHPLYTGAGPIRGSNSGGGLPGSFPAVTDLWAIALSANTFSVATSLANAIAGVAITMSTAGTGTQTINHQLTTARVSDVTVTRNLIVGGKLTVGGRKAVLDGTIMVPVVPPSTPAAPPPTSLAATISGSGSGLSPLIAPLPVVVGRTITGLRARIVDNVTGPTTLVMTIVTTTDGALTFSGALATSNVSSGAGAEQTLTISGVSLLVAPSTQYWALVVTSSGSASCKVHRMELDMPSF